MENSTETIWNNCRQLLSQFIRKRVNDQSAVDDILQDVFVKIHSNIETVNNKEKISSWIYQITRNTIIDYYRNKKQETELNESSLIYEDNHENESYLRLEKGLMKMINRLPPIYSEALLLTDYEGLTQKELSEKLGISLPGAKSRVQRARKLLKELYMKRCHIEFDRKGMMVDVYPKTCSRCSSAASNN
ncbi:MAG: RNA polymerase sigma factor SigZ [Ignavibacteriaceae bacterium]|jgi:RNA polymerase sigma-70 factor (ECF subfamily)